MNYQSNQGRLVVVVGGQFGSEGKGHLTAQLAARVAPGSLVIRTGGPNAGHTVWRDGTEYKLRHLPTPIAVRSDINIALGAKSVVDPSVLRAELERFPDRGIFVDPAATILEPDHIQHEVDAGLTNRIGSTSKGIGAARADRIERQARTAYDLWGADGRGGSELDERIYGTSVRELAYATLAQGSDVIIEAAQGYGLGLHTAYYPYCTSADCTALDALADSQISPWAVGITPMVWMAIRPYPIRVAGNSGPMFSETTWADLGLPEERTTVTNKVRRVGGWDPALARLAAEANGVQGGRVRIGLLMADQVVPDIAGATDAQKIAELATHDPRSGLPQLLHRISTDTGAPIGAIGTGPQTMVFSADVGLEGF